MSKTNATVTAPAPATATPAKPHRGGVKVERATRGPLPKAAVEAFLGSEFFTKATEVVTSPEPKIGRTYKGRVPVDLTGVQVGALLQFCQDTSSKEDAKALLADFPEAKQAAYIAVFRKALGDDIEVPEYKHPVAPARGKGSKGKPVQEPVTITNDKGEIPGFEVVRGKMSVEEIEKAAAEVAAEAEASTMEVDFSEVPEITEDMTFAPETEIGEKAAADLADQGVEEMEYADGLGSSRTKADMVAALQAAGDKRATATLMKMTKDTLEGLLVEARKVA